jgi:hypothetical protein
VIPGKAKFSIDERLEPKPSYFYNKVMAAGDFRWNAWNVEHIAKHGVTPAEAEHVVRFAKRPYPQRHRRGSWLVIGRGNSNRPMRVVYILDPDKTFFIIHAMPL